MLLTAPRQTRDLDRLLAAIRKLSTIEQAEIKRFSGSIVLKVRGSAQGTILLTAARSAGFRLSQMPVRTYVATGPAQDTDVWHDCVKNIEKAA